MIVVTNDNTKSFVIRVFGNYRVYLFHIRTSGINISNSSAVELIQNTLFFSVRSDKYQRIINRQIINNVTGNKSNAKLFERMSNYFVVDDLTDTINLFVIFIDRVLHHRNCSFNTKTKPGVFCYNNIIWIVQSLPPNRSIAFLRPQKHKLQYLFCLRKRLYIHYKKLICQ